MIEPSIEDVGRHVIYTDRPGGKVEQGVITSFSEHYVFVRYGADVHSKATRRIDLQWSEPR
jgi:hypothetical protein